MNAMPGRDDFTDQERQERIRRQNRERSRRYKRNNRPKVNKYQRDYRRSRSRSALKELAIVQNYDELRAVLTKRRRDLGLSQWEVDQISGMQDGYTGKLEIGRADKKAEGGTRSTGREAGKVSLYLWLKALGLKLVVIEE